LAKLFVRPSFFLRSPFLELPPLTPSFFPPSLFFSPRAKFGVLEFFLGVPPSRCLFPPRFPSFFLLFRISFFQRMPCCYFSTVLFVSSSELPPQLVEPSFPGSFFSGLALFLWPTCSLSHFAPVFHFFPRKVPLTTSGPSSFFCFAGRWPCGDFHGFPHFPHLSSDNFFVFETWLFNGFVNF